MSNYNSQLQSNNTDLQAVLQALQSKALTSQAAPEISVSSNGLITAIAGTKLSTQQLAFQPAKTITPSAASQIAVSGGYYTGGDITVAAVPTQSKTVTPTSTVQNVTPDSGKFLSKVTVNVVPTQSKTITPTSSTQDVTPDSGKFLSKVTINAIPSTYVQPTATKTATTYTPTTTAQTIASGTYLTGTQTIAGDSNLVAGNIKSGVSIFGVSGTLVESSGSGEAAEWSENEDAIIADTLTSYFNNRVEVISGGVFTAHTNLKEVNFPACKIISCFDPPGTDCFGAFAYCTNLTTANFQAATTIGSYAFQYCTNLTTVNFPVATNIGNRAFYSCTSLTTVNFPAATAIDDYAFTYCSKLTTISFPVATNIGSSAFYRCPKLTTANFPVAISIGGWAFYNCYNLKSLYLTGPSLCKLSNSNAFGSTPIGGYSAFAGTYGSIYVPASLLTSYQTATNWTYFSSRFVGI